MIMPTTICSVLLVLICCLSLGPATTVSGQVQKTDMKVIQGGGGQCPSNEERERAINEIHQTVGNVLSSYVPDICDGTTGWRRVAFINMTDTTHSCPPGLNMTTYSERTCGRTHTGRNNCSSTTFSVGGLPYSQVCGRISAYQYGVLVAFYSYIYDNQTGINSQYVDGISLTHGQSGERQHIWTFAAGLTQDTDAILVDFLCPCESSHYNYSLPPFVGDEYFCESGLQTAWLDGDYYHTLYSNNTLWDGQNCISSSTCCQFNSPPWFTKTLNVSTTDDIELRLCTVVEPSWSGDVALELVELYVK